MIGTYKGWHKKNRKKNRKGLECRNFINVQLHRISFFIPAYSINLYIYLTFF